MPTYTFPFATVGTLFGGERLSTKSFSPRVIVVPEPPTLAQTGFAMAFGGGMDYTLVPRHVSR